MCVQLAESQMSHAAAIAYGQAMRKAKDNNNTAAIGIWRSACDVHSKKWMKRIDAVREGMQRMLPYYVQVR